MAQMSVYESKDFNALWDFDFGGYATEALEEASDIVEGRMKANAKQVITHAGDSAMVDSIKKSKPKQTKNGAWIINVGPRGYSSNHVYYAKDGKGVRTKRKYKVSNALKAIWKEYGIPGHQSAKPFISKTVTQTQNQVYDLLQRKFEEHYK